MFLGLDCSTQSLSALIIDAENGTIEHTESVRFHSDLPEFKTTHGFVRGTEPDEFFSCPLMWLDALDLLFKRLLDKGYPLNEIKGISGSAQQHGTVYLKQSAEDAMAKLDPTRSLSVQLEDHYSRPVSPIWLDASTGTECQEIADTFGGNTAVCQTSGSPATLRFSASQIRKYAKQYPERFAETHKIHLVSSYFSSILTGQHSAIDYGDGAGMNLMNLKNFQWDHGLTDATFSSLIEKLPELQPSTEMSGLISPYFVKKYGFSPTTKCFNWSGDNPCSLIGMGASQPSKWVISLGTSYTMFSATEKPHIDPNGFGNVFGNPLGGYMSLSCFKNGVLACFSLREKLEIGWEEFDQLARILPTESDSPTLPFFETEITPRHRSTDQSKTTVRSFLDGQFLNMKHQSSWMGEQPECMYITGGVSASLGVCQTIANIFQIPIHRLQSSSSAALGAAMRAAHSSGYDMPHLESKLCPTKNTIFPQPEAAKIYEGQMEKFIALLDK